MKKQVLAISLGIMSLAAVAQKVELKEAEKALRGKNYTEALTAINPLEGTIESADAKSKARFYAIKAQAMGATDNYEGAVNAFDNLKQTKNKYLIGRLKTILNVVGQEASSKAIGHYNNGEYKEASKEFYGSYALKIKKDTTYLYNAAVSASQGKELDHALKYYTKLKEIGYTGIESRYVATNVETGELDAFPDKYTRNSYVKQKTHTDPTIKVSKSKKADIVKNIALILKEQGKTDEALAAMSEARKESPEDYSLLIAEANLYFESGNKEKFEELMEEAVKVDPNNANLFFNLGAINQNHGDVPKASKYYKKAIELDPKKIDAYKGLYSTILSQDQKIVDKMNNIDASGDYEALLKERKDVYSEALPYVLKADELQRTSSTVKNLMVIYDMLEQPGQADQYRALYKQMR